MKGYIIDKMKDKIGEYLSMWSSTTACFTGHRCEKLPWGYNEKDIRCLKMKKRVRNEIEFAISNGYRHFISGMALGFDMICAEIVLELKEIYPYITLECAIPYKGQSNMWSEIYKKRYNNILLQADKVRCIYTHFVRGCMHERNRYMVNNSSMIIALYSGLSGGTKYTLNYALKQGLIQIVINPEEF